MIAKLKGVLDEKDLDKVIVDVSGVGYEVFVSSKSMARLPNLKDEVVLQIYTNVREDAITLFGFASNLEKKLFETLISVNGIGAKSAMQILSAAEPDEFVTKILMNDKQGLTDLPGIGKKTAERLILELKDKIKNIDVGISSQSAKDGEGTNNLRRAKTVNVLTLDAIAALVGLGYRESQARDIVDITMQKLGETAKLENVITEALRMLSNQVK